MKTLLLLFSLLFFIIIIITTIIIIISCKERITVQVTKPNAYIRVEQICAHVEQSFVRFGAVLEHNMMD